jgi:hypothetical protein
MTQPRLPLSIIAVARVIIEQPRALRKYGETATGDVNLKKSEISIHALLSAKRVQQGCGSARKAAVVPHSTGLDCLAACSELATCCFVKPAALLLRLSPLHRPCLHAGCCYSPIARLCLVP